MRQRFSDGYASGALSNGIPNSVPRNVIGGKLKTCCKSPKTGFYRNGRCDTGPADVGVHTVCAQMTSEFLAFSKAAGNDLSTPRPQLRFPGLKPGDCWCLCADRWQEAFEAGKAPLVRLESTHELTLQYVELDDLMAYALKPDED